MVSIGERPGSGNAWGCPVGRSLCAPVSVHLQLLAQRADPPPDHGALFCHPRHAGRAEQPCPPSPETTHQTAPHSHEEGEPVPSASPPPPSLPPTCCPTPEPRGHPAGWRPAQDASSQAPRLVSGDSWALSLAGQNHASVLGGGGGPPELSWGRVRGSRRTCTAGVLVKASGCLSLATNRRHSQPTSEWPRALPGVRGASHQSLPWIPLL